MYYSCLYSDSFYSFSIFYLIEVQVFISITFIDTNLHLINKCFILPLKGFIFSLMNSGVVRKIIAESWFHKHGASLRVSLFI